MFSVLFSGMKTPVEAAAAVYEREVCARSFREDLEAHLLHGYVFSTPDFFVMLRPVDSAASYAQVTDPWVTFPPERWDAWWIYLMAGDMKKARAYFPFILPKIGFERTNKLRYHGFQFLERYAPRIRTSL